MIEEMLSNAFLVDGTSTWGFYGVILFWMLVALIVYTYAGFAVLVYLRGRWFPRPIQEGTATPRVSMLIACYNEQSQIEDKLQNTYALDYPMDKLQIIVASDGSSDATEEIVERHTDRVLLLRRPRQGKARALNAAASHADGEVLLFSDADVMLRPNALRALMRAMSDPAVGGAAGDLQYLKAERTAGVQEGERSYWSFDRWLKRQQTRAGSVTSATGAIYAVRRELFEPIPDGMTDDFIVSTRVVAAGKRLVFVEDAVAYGPVAESSSAEFQRKVRLMTRGLRGIIEMRRLLNPFRYGFYSWQLFSHKVLRRLIVFPILLLIVLSPLLWNQGWVYRVAAISAAVFLVCAGLGRWAALRHWRSSRVLTLPAFFVLANSAAALAAINIIRGRRFDVWNPQRGSQVACGP